MKFARATVRRASSMRATTTTSRGGAAATTTRATRMRARVVARGTRADGGMQEFEAAKAAILNVRPNANVVANRVDKYPITVTVSSGGKDVWSGRQQGLFRKNGRPAMKEIEDAMRGLQ